jgi:hypothetical protein
MQYSKVRRCTQLSKFTVKRHEFISVLNNLRNNQITAADVQALNKYVKPDFDLKQQRLYHAYNPQ